MRTIVVSGLMIATMFTYAVPQIDATAMGEEKLTWIKAELQTALYHIGELAREGPGRPSYLMPPRHGQHVINCLEGPKGTNYEQFIVAGNPCEGKGNGIIPDVKDLAAANVPGAQEALKQATLAWNVTLQGMANKNPDEVNQWAKSVERYLKAALDALKA